MCLDTLDPEDRESCSDVWAMETVGMSPKPDRREESSVDTLTIFFFPLRKSCATFGRVDVPVHGIDAGGECWLRGCRGSDWRGILTVNAVLLVTCSMLFYRVDWYWVAL